MACLVSHYKSFNFTVYEEIDLVLVLLGCETEEHRFSESIKIIDWAIEMIAQSYYNNNNY